MSMTVPPHTRIDFYKYQLIATVTVFKHVQKADGVVITIDGDYAFPLAAFSTRIVTWKEVVE